MCKGGLAPAGFSSWAWLDVDGVSPQWDPSTAAASCTARPRQGHAAFLATHGDVLVDWLTRGFQKFTVQLVADEERAADESIDLRTDEVDQSRVFRRHEDTERPNQRQSQGDGQTSGWQIVEDHMAGAAFERQGQSLQLTQPERATTKRLWQRVGDRANVDPCRKDGHRPRDFAGHGRRNQYRREELR